MMQRLHDQSLKELLVQIEAAKNPITLYVDRRLRAGRPADFVDTMFVPMVMSEFNRDPQLGMLTGESGMFALRVAAIQKAKTVNPSIRTHDELVAALEAEGYAVRESPLLA